MTTIKEYHINGECDDNSFMLEDKEIIRLFRLQDLYGIELFDYCYYTYLSEQLKKEVLEVLKLKIDIIIEERIRHSQKLFYY